MYQDEYLVVVHKPAGVPVHRTAGVPTDVVPLLQQVRDQIGAYLYPLHRLDRPTSGLVLFGLREDVVQPLQQLWASGQVRKTYHALVRGWMPAPCGETREALEDSRGIVREAWTRWRVREQCELSFAVDRYPQVRYSWLELEPLSGRWHQLRLHLSHLHHPILGDTRHGDRHHNHFLQELLGWWRLHLTAVRLELPHPVTGATLCINDAPERGLTTLWERLRCAQPQQLYLDGNPELPL